MTVDERCVSVRYGKRLGANFMGAAAAVCGWSSGVMSAVCHKTCVLNNTPIMLVQACSVCQGPCAIEGCAEPSVSRFGGMEMKISGARALPFAAIAPGLFH